MAGTLRRIGIVGGVRTPFCRSNTLYADLSNLDLMTAALNGLVDKYRLKGVHIDEVVGGAVVTHSKDFNLAREAVLGTKLAPSTPGITIQQACGTSLQAAAMIGAKIASGEIECGIAVGSDTTSDAPIVFSKKFSGRMIQVSQQKTLMDRIRVFKGFSPSELAPQPPNVAEPRTGLTMGQHCELMAREWKDRPPGTGPLRLRKPPQGRRRLSLRLHGRSDRADRRRVPRQQPARGHEPRQARDAQDRLRQNRQGHADGRELHADDGRRGLRAAV